MVWWLTQLTTQLIRQSMNSDSAQAQILPVACQRSAMVRVSDSSPGWI